MLFFFLFFSETGDGVLGGDVCGVRLGSVVAAIQSH